MLLVIEITAGLITGMIIHWAGYRSGRKHGHRAGFIAGRTEGYRHGLSRGHTAGIYQAAQFLEDTADKEIP